MFPFLTLLFLIFINKDGEAGYQRVPPEPPIPVGVAPPAAGHSTSLFHRMAIDRHRMQEVPSRLISGYQIPPEPPIPTEGIAFPVPDSVVPRHPPPDDPEPFLTNVNAAVGTPSVDEISDGSDTKKIARKKKQQVKQQQNWKKMLFYVFLLVSMVVPQMPQNVMLRNNGQFISVKPEFYQCEPSFFGGFQCGFQLDELALSVNDPKVEIWADVDGDPKTLELIGTQDLSVCVADGDWEYCPAHFEVRQDEVAGLQRMPVSEDITLHLHGVYDDNPAAHIQRKMLTMHDNDPDNAMDNAKKYGNKSNVADGHLPLFFSSMPIDRAFPEVFPQGTGINVSSDTIHGVSGAFRIDQFPTSQKNRSHYEPRAEGAMPTFLILHYTVGNIESTVNTFTADLPSGRVSAHYVITEREEGKVAGGKLLQVVPDEQTAWHAGISGWGRDINLNGISLGIEHVNKGFINGTAGQRSYFSFDEAQINISGILSQNLVDQFGIPALHVLGHEDIAPGRKSDPGPLFPWGHLYHHYGIGAWLDKDEMMPEEIKRKYHPSRPYPANPDQRILMEMLDALGYRHINNATDSDIIKAFKSHFSANQLPDHYNDHVGQSEMFWAWALEAKYGTKQ